MIAVYHKSNQFNFINALQKYFESIVLLDFSDMDRNVNDVIII